MRLQSAELSSYKKKGICLVCCFQTWLLAFTSCKPKPSLSTVQHLGLLQPQLHLEQTVLVKAPVNPSTQPGDMNILPRCSWSKPRNCQCPQGRASTLLTLCSEGNVHNKETPENVQHIQQYPIPLSYCKTNQGIMSNC